MAQTGKSKKRKLASVSLQDLIVGSTIFCLWIYASCQVVWDLASGMKWQGFGFPFPMAMVLHGESSTEYHWSIIGLVVDFSFGLFITIQAMWIWQWVRQKATLFLIPTKIQETEDLSGRDLDIAELETGELEVPKECS